MGRLSAVRGGVCTVHGPVSPANARQSAVRSRRLSVRDGVHAGGSSRQSPSRYVWCGEPAKRWPGGSKNARRSARFTRSLEREDVRHWQGWQGWVSGRHGSRALGGGLLERERWGHRRPMERRMECGRRGQDAYGRSNLGVQGRGRRRATAARGGLGPGKRWGVVLQPGDPLVGRTGTGRRSVGGDKQACMGGRGGRQAGAEVVGGSKMERCKTRKEQDSKVERTSFT